MMNTDPYFYEPVQGHGLRHSPLNSIIAPRPIGWISTLSARGVRNLAPFSFFNLFNYTPPIIGFASNGRKDSAVNAETTGEFCWNLVSAELADQMNRTSAQFPPDVDEFDDAGLTPAESRIISAPHVVEALAVFECRTTEVHRLRTATGEETSTRMVFGEVVGIHIDRTLIHDGIYSTTAAQPVLRGGGPTSYYRVFEENSFHMHRP